MRPCRPAELYDPAPHVYYWFGGFCALSIVASLVGLVPGVRRGFGRFRPVADPARRRGSVAAIVTLAATIVATILAGLGGVLQVSVAGVAAPSDGLELTGLALGAALLGGTSAYGRRGGIFGTVLAVALLTVIARYSDEAGLGWPVAALAAVAIGLGLAVTRLVERLGRPRAMTDRPGRGLGTAGSVGRVPVLVVDRCHDDTRRPVGLGRRVGHGRPPVAWRH